MNDHRIFYTSFTPSDPLSESITTRIPANDISISGTTVDDGIHEYTIGNEASTYSWSLPNLELGVYSKKQVQDIVDEKLNKFADRIYDILKELDKIEISREEWISLLEEPT